MDAVTAGYAGHAPAAATPVSRVARLLQLTYGVVPIVAGADKFLELLADWDKYLSPLVARIVPLQPAVFMSIVGAVEIVAGIMVLTRPRLGSLVVAFWLLAIALNLLLTGQYFDVAVRDLVMAIGAFSLYLLLKPRSRRVDEE